MGEQKHTPREEQIAAYAEHLAQRLDFHKQRVDAGLDPRCGLRLMTPDSASVVADVPLGCAHPFAQFSLDSRDPELYAMAHQAAADLVSYAAISRATSETPEKGE